jgi:hypothetical protein
MSAPLTLETLQADFRHWREHKPSPRSQVPKDLRNKVLAIKHSVKISQLTQALGVNSSMIKSWATKENALLNSADQPPKFISLPADSTARTHQEGTLPAATHTNQAQLSFEVSNGRRWCLQGDLNPQQITAFINASNPTTGTSQ